jgi:hypothetical protein
MPNAATRRAMRDAETGRNLIRAESMDELRSKLDTADERRTRPGKRRVRSSR